MQGATMKLRGASPELRTLNPNHCWDSKLELRLPAVLELFWGLLGGGVEGY